MRQGHALTIIGGRVNLMLRAECKCGWIEVETNQGQGQTDYKKDKLISAYKAHKESSR